LNHTGTVGELLEKISFATKYSFSADRDMLSWSRFETAEFQVASLAGKTDYFFGNTNGDQNQTNQANAGQQIVIDSGYDNSAEFINFSTEGLSVWSDLEETLKILMSGAEGAQLRINQAAGTVVVKDYPDNVGAIRRHIERENDRLTKMVAVDIQIVDATNSTGDTRAINWDVIKQNLAAGGVLTASSAFESLTRDNLAPSVLGWTQETGKYAGSSALISALNSYGVTTKTVTKRVIGLNNQVSKIQNGGEFFFLARSGSSSTANVGSEDSLTPGVIKLGDTVYMLPNAVGDEIILQLSTRMSALKTEVPRRVTDGNKSIEAPETLLDKLFIKFAVKDGETLLIAGSSEDSLQYIENSTGGTIALGGEKSGSKASKERLVLITPRIISR
jgi:type IVB pilus formation R64 PilN family outer membrane protein